MTQPRASQPKIGFIDQYCSQYQSIFAEVRSYEAFKQIIIDDTGGSKAGMLTKASVY